MSAFPGSPKLIRGGLVLLDPDSGSVRRVITLQYNSDQISRTLQVQGSGDGGARSEALRLRGPAIETIKLEAELDAADQLAVPLENQTTVRFGLHPEIAALEQLVSPSRDELLAQNDMAAAGTIEVLSTEAPLTLFVWGPQRLAPVRVTELSITEEAFDVSLNPIRAKVSLGLRVLTVDDLGFRHKGGALFLDHLKSRESMAAKAPKPGLDALGIGGRL